MKTLTESINESRMIEYSVAFSSILDNEGMPLEATILVDKSNQKEFEKWLESEEGNTFEHAEGGHVEF